MSPISIENKNVMPKIPDITDQHVHEFAKLIASDPCVKMSPKVSIPEYPDSHQLKMVPFHPESNAKTLECWFNCIDAAKAGKGEPVFGWAIWEEEDGEGDKILFSQHHAVLRTEGGLIDITPAENSNFSPPHILFMPDHRVPFDPVSCKVPACFLWYPPPFRGGCWASRDRLGSWKPLESYSLL